MNTATSAMSARVLIVEDEAIIAAELQDRLQRRGFVTLGPVDTAAAAVSMVEAERPDLVLMDIRLKGDRDGIAAASEVYERFATPVLFLTANADLATYRRALGAMPYGYVVKPFNERDLVVAVDTALIRARAERALRQDSLTFGAIAAAVADAVLVTDATGQIRYLNAAAERLTGWLWTDLVGRSRAEALPLTETGGQISVSAAGKATLMNGTVRTRDGRTVSVVERRVDVTDPSGVRIGTVSSITDVEELDRLRDAKAESEALSETVFAHSPFPMALLDRSGAVQRMNSAFQYIVRRGTEQLPFPASALVDETYTDRLQTQLRAPQPERTAPPVELVFRAGEAAPIMISSTMVSVPGTVHSADDRILWYCLPIDQQKRLITTSMAREEDQRAPRNASLPFGRVLVVEDEPSLRQIIRRMLERLGLRVHIAGNGREALEFLHVNRADVDLVLTDIVMPYVSGGELSQRIDAEFPGLAVVFMSGYHDDRFVRDAEDYSRRTVVRKPFTHAELIEALREAFISAGDRQRPD